MSSLLKFAIACAACAVVTAAEQPRETSENINPATELVSLPTPDQYIKNEANLQTKEMCYRIAGDFIRAVNYYGFPINVVNVCDMDQSKLFINVLKRINILAKDVTTMDQLNAFLQTHDNLRLLANAMVKHSLVRYLALSNVDIARTLFTNAVDNLQLKSTLVTVLGNQDIARAVVSVLFGDAHIRTIILQDASLRRMLIRNYLVRAGIVSLDTTAQQFRDLVREQPAAMISVVRTILGEPILKTLVVDDVDFLRYIAQQVQRNSQLRTLVFRDVNFVRSMLAQSLRNEILKKTMMAILNEPNTMDAVRSYFMSDPSFRSLFLGDKQFRRLLIRTFLAKSNIITLAFPVDQIRSFMIQNPTYVLRIVNTMVKDDVLRSLILRDVKIVRAIYDHALQDAEIKDAFLTVLRDAQVLRATVRYLITEPKIRAMIMQDARIVDLMKTIDTTVSADDVMRAQLRHACKKYAAFFTNSIDLGNLKLRITEHC